MILPYGASGYYLDLDWGSAPDRAARTQGASHALRTAFPETDVVCGGGVVALFGIEPSRALEQRLEQIVAGTGAAPVSSRRHVLATVYDGADLAEVARAVGLTETEVIRLHSESELSVELNGFLPGFSYLGGLDALLTVPRRASPRPRVAAGSVALAAGFSAVYPLDSPGGWSLLGRVIGATLFDAERDPAALLQVGDSVRFEPVEAADLPARSMPTVVQPASARPACSSGFYIERCQPGVTVQDRGRLGRCAAGLPPSGPLDSELGHATNRALGNAADAALLELFQGSLEIRASGSLWLSVDGAPARQLADGERFIVEQTDKAVRYLGLAGGVDVPLQLGSRSTLQVARLGGYRGRSLRRGDFVACGAIAQGSILQDLDSPARAQGQAVVIELLVGPHASRFAADAFQFLLDHEYTVSVLGDRVGQRLDGPKIPGKLPELALPVPMLRGAMQITSDGTPIVLGPDHPTTGGYPVLAVVAPRSLGSLAQCRPGRRVRFRL